MKKRTNKILLIIFLGNLLINIFIVVGYFYYGNRFITNYSSEIQNNGSIETLDSLDVFNDIWQDEEIFD